MAQKRFSIRAALGRLSIGGVGALRATDVSVSIAGQEIVARSGCDVSPWYRALDQLDLTGSLTIQDYSPEIMAAISGASIETAGWVMVDREAVTLTAGGALLAGASGGDPLTNEDGTLAGVVYSADSNGETVFTQIAPDGTPAAGEFCMDTADPDTLITAGADDGTVVYVSYAYTTALAKMLRVMDTSEPPNVSLLLPVCGVDLGAQGVKTAAGVYIPRVRFLNRDFNAAPAGGELQGQTLSFSGVPAADGELYRYIFPV